MKLNYLEEKLKKIHHEQNPQVLDDDLPDHFDQWFMELDQNYILDVAYAVQVENDGKAYQAGIDEAVEKRNGVIKEYKDEGVMFILKVVDGKTYEASMPIPKWAEVGKLTLRDDTIKALQNKK